jgi:hypothetical protein
MSLSGKLPTCDVCCPVANGGKSDIERQPNSVATDPNRIFGLIIIWHKKAPNDAGAFSLLEIES